jgi:hypothetical protein
LIFDISVAIKVYMDGDSAQGRQVVGGSFSPAGRPEGKSSTDE